MAAGQQKARPHRDAGKEIAAGILEWVHEPKILLSLTLQLSHLICPEPSALSLISRNMLALRRLSGEQKSLDQLNRARQAPLDMHPRRPYNINIRNRMSKTKADHIDLADDRELYSGLIRLHVLHHAAHEPIFGLGMVEELARHGYRISPGTLYPLLHGLAKKGYLRAAELRNGKSRRKVYRATRLGRNALRAATSKVRVLFRELMEGK
jgi:DNA-binding PadR family transcriptional regulator